MLSLFLWQNDRINQSSVIFSFKYISLFVPPSTEEFVAQLYSICAARRRAKVVVMEDIQEKYMLTLQNMHQIFNLLLYLIQLLVERLVLLRTINPLLGVTICMGDRIIVSKAFCYVAHGTNC
jgi:hypothetical protein